MVFPAEETACVNENLGSLIDLTEVYCGRSKDNKVEDV